VAKGRLQGGRFIAPAVEPGRRQTQQKDSMKMAVIHWGMLMIFLP
jgi:hypothetical protein